MTAGGVPDQATLEGICALHDTRRSAAKSRAAAMRQIHAQLITAPERHPREVPRHAQDKCLAVLARMYVPDNQTPVERAVLLALETLAQR